MLGDPKGTEKWVNSNYLTTPFMSPANFSFLMGSGAILAFGNYLIDKKMMYLFLFVFLTGAVVWAFTRISIVGLIISIYICVLFLSKSYLVKIILPVIFLSVFIVMFLSIDSLINRMFHNDELIDVTEVLSNPEKLLGSLNTSGRSTLWGLAHKKFFNQSPILGSGVGSVDDWFADEYDSVRLHSEYLRVLYDLGILGLMLYIGAILYFYRLLLKVFRENDNVAVKKNAAIAISGLTYYIITLATDNTLNYVTEFGVYIYAFIALALVRDNVSIINDKNNMTVDNYSHLKM